VDKCQISIERVTEQHKTIGSNQGLFSER